MFVNFLVNILWKFLFSFNAPNIYIYSAGSAQRKSFRQFFFWFISQSKISFVTVWSESFVDSKIYKVDIKLCRRTNDVFCCSLVIRNEKKSRQYAESSTGFKKYLLCRFKLKLICTTTGAIHIIRTLKQDIFRPPSFPTASGNVCKG